MSFNKLALPTPLAGSSIGGTGVSSSVFIPKSGDPRVNLTVSARIYAQVGARPGDKWLIMEGSDGDAGYLRMSVEEDGVFTPKITKKGAAFLFRLGELVCAPLHKQTKRWCSVKVEGRSLVVRLPSWAFPHDISRSPLPADDGRAQPKVTSVRGNIHGGPAVNLGEPAPDYHARREAAEKAGKLVGSALKRKPGI